MFEANFTHILSNTMGVLAALEIKQRNIENDRFRQCYTGEITFE